MGDLVQTVCNAFASFINSELHFMHSIVSGQGEASAQVLLKEFCLVLSNVLNEFSVNGSLELGAFLRNLLLWGLLEDGSASTLLLALGESLVADSVGLDSSSAHLGGGGDSVDLVDASEWNTVDLHWSSNEEQARLELLEENNSLTTESSRGEDEDAASLNARSELWSLSFLCANLSLLVFGRVPIDFFDH